jgi:hypothetical protein
MKKAFFIFHSHAIFFAAQTVLAVRSFDDFIPARCRWRSRTDGKVFRDNGRAALAAGGQTFLVSRDDGPEIRMNLFWWTRRPAKSRARPARRRCICRRSNAVVSSAQAQVEIHPSRDTGKAT